MTGARLVVFGGVSPLTQGTLVHCLGPKARVYSLCGERPRAESIGWIPAPAGATAPTCRGCLRGWKMLERLAQADEAGFCPEKQGEAQILRGLFNGGHVRRISAKGRGRWVLAAALAALLVAPALADDPKMDRRPQRPPPLAPVGFAQPRRPSLATLDPPPPPPPPDPISLRQGPPVARCQLSPTPSLCTVLERGLLVLRQRLLLIIIILGALPLSLLAIRKLA